MVLVATRSESTSGSPTQQRPTARTILLTSTGSKAPLRLRTRMLVCGADSSSGSGRREVGWGGRPPLWLGTVSISMRLLLVGVGHTRRGEVRRARQTRAEPAGPRTDLPPPRAAFQVEPTTDVSRRRMLAGL